MNKILYFTNTFPKYRKELWRLLILSKKFDFHFYFSKKIFNGIKQVKLNENFSISELNHFHFIKNRTLNNSIFWQSGKIITLIKNNYSKVIFLGDMKIISNWIGIIICRLRGKEVYFWTHGLYGNEFGLKKLFRLFFLSLADGILLYENKSRKRLIQNGFSKRKLHVVYNSTNLSDQTVIFKKLYKKKSLLKRKEIRNLLFVGRLTKLKKVDLIIKALYYLNSYKIKYKLKIVGDGKEKENLKNLADKFNAKNYIKFIDAIYEEDKLGALFIEADMLVSPGNVGLNAIHSLSYGTPVLTHNNLINQMPEHEAIIENFNGIFHKEDNAKSIMNKLEEWFSISESKNLRINIRKKLIEKYNPEYQINIFERVLS
tara:strand:+ start:521 stop:1636 length:1116 start_codon:yes stop_codon:yes gene_type:complete